MDSLRVGSSEDPEEIRKGYLRLPRILGGGFSTRKGLDGLPALWAFLAAAGFALAAVGFACGLAVFFAVLFLSLVGMVS